VAPDAQRIHSPVLNIGFLPATDPHALAGAPPEK